MKQYEHKLYYSKNCTWNSGKVKRLLKIKLLDIIGQLNNVPIDKTYQNKSHNITYLKLEIEERGFIEQRLHSLYVNSKKGYYCVICGRKCYFDTNDIINLYKGI